MRRYCREGAWLDKCGSSSTVLSGAGVSSLPPLARGRLGTPLALQSHPVVILTDDAEPPEAAKSVRLGRRPQLCNPAGALGREVGQPCPAQAAVE